MIAGRLRWDGRRGKAYRAPAIRRVYIPNPGKREMRPLGVPRISDRALQRGTAQVGEGCVIV
jgi:retron-type reverse transcriptase